MKNFYSSKIIRKTQFYIGISLILFFTPGLKSQDISTVGEIYDFETGDIFHYEGKYYGEYKKAIYEITDKYYSTDNDTVYYIRSYQRLWQYTGDTTWNYSSGTTTDTYSQLDSLINDGEITNVYIDPQTGRITNQYSPCDCEFLNFTEGLGLTYDYFWDGIVIRDYKLVYYKKGEEEWGNPLNLFTGIKKKDKQTNFEIYPNPALNSTNIDLTNCDKNFIRVNILSISGNIMESVSIENNKINQIDLSGLESGVYIIELNTSDNKYYRKIIKQ